VTAASPVRSTLLKENQVRLPSGTVGLRLATGASIAAALVLFPVTDSFSASGGKTDATCSFEVHETAKPGFGSTPSQGTSTTNPGGVLTCDGLVDGVKLSGKPGTLWYEYHFATKPPNDSLRGDTCYLFSGDGPVRATVPTADGRQLSLTGLFKINQGTTLGALNTGTLGGADFQFVVTFRLEEGHYDELCVNQPIRHFITSGVGKVSG
jgi:hypothetical protein